MDRNSLDYKKVMAKRQIDETAGWLRGQFVTTTEGQDAVYLEKAKQAIAFQSTGFDVATIDTFPMIKLEAEVIGSTYQAFAELVIANSSSWAILGAIIEAMRISHKKMVDDSTDIEGVRAALESCNFSFTKDQVLSQLG